MNEKMCVVCYGSGTSTCMRCGETGRTSTALARHLAQTAVVPASSGAHAVAVRARSLNKRVPKTSSPTSQGRKQIDNDGSTW